MRTILAMALAANIFFSVGANYLQGAHCQPGGRSVEHGQRLASTTSQPAEESSAF